MSTHVSSKYFFEQDPIILEFFLNLIKKDLRKTYLHSKQLLLLLHIHTTIYIR